MPYKTFSLKNNIPQTRINSIIGALFRGEKTVFRDFIKGPIHDSDLQSQPRCAARSRLRLLLMVYPHTQRPICSIFLS